MIKKLDHWMIIHFQEFLLAEPSWYMSHCTMLYKYGKRSCNFSLRYYFYCSLVSRAFLIKQLFHLRLLEMS